MKKIYISLRPFIKYLVKIIWPVWIFEKGNEESLRYAYIGISTVLVSIIALAFFSYQAFANNFILHGFVQIIFAASLVLLVLYYRITNDSRHFAAEAGVFLFGLYCFYIIIYGAVGSTTFVWAYAFPITTMFILGSRKGAFVLLLFFLPMVTMLFFDNYFPFVTHYSYNLKLRFTLSLLVVSILSYLYQRIIENYSEKLNHTMEELIKTKDNIEHQVVERTYEVHQTNEKLLHEIEKRKKVETEREALISELQEALKEIRKLSGLLPICSSCKKIRNDEGDWEHLEVYICNRSEAEFTHGICPDCTKRLYPGIIE